MGLSNYFTGVDPIDLIDFTIRHVDWLAGDQITGSSWTSPSGGVISTSTFTTGTATVWVISGTVGVVHQYENVVGTLAGRRLNESLYVKFGDQ